MSDIISKPNGPFDACVLQGNASKSLITLGALQFLYDTNKFNAVEKFFGTSSGAITSFFLIIGYTPSEILSYLCVNKVFDGRLSHFNMMAVLQGYGAASWSKFQEILEKMTIDKIGYLPTLKGLKDNFHKDLTLTTYNASTSETIYLSADTYPDLPALVALRMTSNIPFLFDKYKYGDSFFVDGAVSDNFPIKKAEDVGSRVIGIRLKREKCKAKIATESFFPFLQRLIMIPVKQNETNQVETARKNTRIETLIDDSKTGFGFKFTRVQVMDLFSSGYRQMKERFTSVKSA
jgi:predicted acylesterase/phospholipase RssA